MKRVLSNRPCDRERCKQLFEEHYPDHVGEVCKSEVEIPLIDVLDIVGLDDTLWCLRAVEGHDSEIRMLAVKYARRVEHLMTDPRSLAALDVAERFANGQATGEELEAARWSAEAAAVAAKSATAESAARAALAAAEAWQEEQLRILITQVNL